MKRRTKEEAIVAIQKLIDTIPAVIKAGRKSQEHIRWIANSLRIIEEIFGRTSMYYSTISSYDWCFSGSVFVDLYEDPNEVYQEQQDIAFQDQLEQATGILLSAIDHLQSSDIDDIYEGVKHQEVGELMKIINLGTSKLRKLIRETPTKEREVQDKYQDLLIAQDIDYSREHPHIEYSSKQYIPDFSFANISLAVEIKLCKSSGDEKAFIAQINDDILAYQTVFEHILFVIYDIGQIRDEDVFKAPFESYSNVIVQIVKH